MTEAEAREKWCPFAGDIRNYGNTSIGNSHRCIASDCMAWRWNKTGRSIHRVGEKPMVSDEVDNTGYCGLAGKP